MQLKVITPDDGWFLYSNVTSDSNIDGTLRIEGEDGDGKWTATFKPGKWDSIELIEDEEDNIEE